MTTAEWDVKQIGEAVTIANPDHLIATLTADVPFDLEMTVRTGRGYATLSENRGGEQELGVIPVDSTFSPVIRVRYRTEDMRVGQRTNYDPLILEVWTKGTFPVCQSATAPMASTTAVTGQRTRCFITRRALRRRRASLG